jgi:tape measure domain-containing protein
VITLGDVIIYVRGDTADADAALSRITSTAQRAASKIGGFFRDALAFATGGLIQRALSGIIDGFGAIPGRVLDAVGSYELLTASIGSLTAKELVQAGAANDFNEALGLSSRMAQETLRWLEALTIQSPFEADDVASAFQLAQGYGFLASATSSVSEAQGLGIVTAQRLTQAMLNQVAATGRSPEVMSRVALALGQINANGKVTAEEINQLAEAGINARRVLADRFTGGSVPELNDLVSRGLIPANEAILALVEDMEIMGSAAQQMGETWPGLIASLSDIATIGLRTLFAPALDQIRPFIVQLVGALQGPAVQGVLQSIGANLGTFVGGGISRVQSLLGSFAAGWRLVAPAVRDTIITLQAVGQIIDGVIARAAGWVTGLVAPFLQGRQLIGDAITQTGQVVDQGLSVIPMTASRILGGLVLAAVQTVQGFLAPWQQGFANAGRVIEQFGSTTVPSALAPLPGYAASILGGLANAAGGWGRGFVIAFADGIASAIGYVVNALSSIASTVSYWLTPGSPPPLLPDLDLWGQGAAESWLDGWSDARFDAFDQFGRNAERLLNNLVGSGQLGQGEAANALLAARGGMLAALESARSGAVGSDALARITEEAGPAAAGLAELSAQYLRLAQASETLERAESELQSTESELRVVQGDLAAAAALGDAGLLAQARNREAALQQQRDELRLQQASARQQQNEAQAAIARQERMLTLQEQQLQILSKLSQEQAGSGGGGGSGGKAAKAAIDQVAEAQWRYAYSIADTATKLQMLRERQAQYGEDSKEYWELQQQIASGEEQLRREQEQAATQEQRELDRQTAQQQRLADAQWEYAYSIADTATRLQMLRDKQGQYTEDSEEYWRLAQQIAATEEQIRREQEQAAKAAASGGGGRAGAAGGAKPAGGGGPDIGALIRANLERSQQEIQATAAQAGERLVTGVNQAVQRRADSLRATFTALMTRATSGIATALAPITSRVAPILSTIRENFVNLAGTITGAWIGLRVALLGINWAAIFGPLLLAGRNLFAIFTGGGPAVQTILGGVGRSLLGLINPFTILIALGAALGTAWAQNLGGIQETVAFALQNVWLTIQAVGGLILTFWQTNGASIVSTFQMAWQQISTIVGTVVSILALIIGTGLQSIAGFIAAHGTDIQTALSGAWLIVQSLILGTLGVIQGAVGAFLALLQGDWSGAWANIQLLSASFVAGIWGILVGAMNMITAMFGTNLATLSATWRSNLTAIQTALTTSMQNILTVATTRVQALYTAVTTRVAVLSRWWSTTWNWIKTALTIVWIAINAATGGKLGELYTAVTGKIDEIKTWISDQASSFFKLGADLLGGLIRGWASKVADFFAAVRNAVTGAVGEGEKAAKTGSPSKLSRDRIGIPLGQGPVVGINQMAGQAAEAMRRLVTGVGDVAADGVTLPIGVGAAATGGALGGSGGPNGQSIGQVLSTMQQLLAELIARPAVQITTGPVQQEIDIEDMAYRVKSVMVRNGSGR